jgi:hypothetical protein
LNSAQLAIVNATAYAGFVIGLAKNTRFIHKASQFDIKSTRQESVLMSYGSANLAPFHYFSKPFNQFFINTTNDELIFTIGNSKQSLTEVRLKHLDFSIPFNEVFSGTYVIDGQSLFSRMIISKPVYRPWFCELKININAANMTKLIDFDLIQEQNFSKLSLIADGLENTPSVHFNFLQNTNYPQINGKFESYRFSSDLDNSLILKHKNSNEETWLLLSDENDSIVINNIQYDIDSSFRSLLAVATIDDLPVEGQNLLAPIKVHTSLNETKLFEKNGIYKIGEWTIKNPNYNLRIQVTDRAWPLLIAYFIYKAKENESLATTYSHYQDARQAVISDFKISETSEITYKNTWGGMISSLAASVGVIGAGIAALFIKRFRPPRPAVMAASVIAPLMGNQEVAAVSIEKEGCRGHWAEKFDVDSTPYEWKGLSYMRIEEERNDYQNKTKYTHYPHQGIGDDPYAGFDQQLILGYYAVRNISKLFFKSEKAVKTTARTKKKPKSVFLDKEFLFFEKLSAKPQGLSFAQHVTSSTIQGPTTYLNKV